MNRFGWLLAGAVVALVGCSGGDASLSPAQEKQVRANFHKAPDINKVTDPKMKAWIQGMMDAQKNGKQIHDVKPPKPTS